MNVLQAFDQKTTSRFFERLNRLFERFAQPEIRVGNRSWIAFRICGYVGVAAGLLLVFAVGMQRGLSPQVLGAIILAAVITFLGLVMVMKLITGEERIIYYHHEIAVLGVTALLMRFLNQPVAAYLDVTILGIGIFLVFGRVGCFMVGCCHGRPHAWGVRYRPEHAAAGFAQYLVGVRLFPVQIIESLCVLGIVIVGVALASGSHPPGTALAWYVITYGVGRFAFEFMRGDAVRPHYLGFSQPQWISLLLMGCVVWAELAGSLPFQWWHSVALVGVLLVMIITGLKRRFYRVPKHRLLHPRHIKEVAEVIENLPHADVAEISSAPWTVFHEAAPRAGITVASTSEGIQISAGRAYNLTGRVDHYALSCQGGDMTEEVATIVAQLIFQLKRDTGSGELITGEQSVFHLILRSASDPIA